MGIYSSLLYPPGILGSYAPPFLKPSLLDFLRSVPLLGSERCIFVSYQHSLERWAYEEFARIFCDEFNVVEDNSPERKKDSEDSVYIMRSLRENHIAGSSCTIVLCGEETRWRRYVDWEIEATLYKDHGLIGVLLPTCRFGSNGGAP
jgi:hypothetical protein